MWPLIILLLVKTHAKPAPSVGVCSGPYVELLVSPVEEDGYHRRLTFSWEGLPSGAEIGVFNGDPGQGIGPVFTYTPGTGAGWANTTIQENHVLYSELGYKPRCLNHFIAYRNSGPWEGISCLRTAPTWMSDLRGQIGDKPLKNLYIPGTHDSSAYKEYDQQHPDDPITKYSVTQDEPILGQLIYGARYIDLRVGYYPRNDEIWWGNHGVYQFHPMSEIFGNITAFLRNTNEIVILDVQEFPVGFGDDNSVHRMFVSYLRETFGEFIAQRPASPWQTSLNQIWNSGKRLIIGYDNGPIRDEFDILWPPVEQKWGDKQHVEDLMSYLNDVISNPPGGSWAAMAQLTPSAADIILNTMKGLRHAAEAVNHEVTAAFRQASWAEKTNVLAIDFLRGSGAVNAAIQWNRGATSCPAVEY